MISGSDDVVKSLVDPVALAQEDEAGGAWGFLSEVLHANNPFAPLASDQQRVDRVREIVTKLLNLLGLHTAELGNREHVLLAQMDVAPDGHVEVVVLNEVSRETRTVTPPQDDGS